MWFTVAIIFIVLGVLFLALRGSFGGFPSNWEWVGIVLAGVGLAMAAPFTLERLWGRSILRTKFENGTIGKSRFLIIYLENPPIRSRILRKLGVKRDTIQSLTVQFSISEAGSGKIVVPIRQAGIYSDDDPTDRLRDRISLPATYTVAASVVIVRWDTQKGKAVVLPDRLREELPLESGQYRVKVIFSVDGEPKMSSRQFVVGEKADDLTWIKPK